MKKRDQCKVQVWNDHSFAWEENFKSKKLTIPGKSFIELPFYEAYEFKGQYVNLLKKADETEDEKTQKRIRCEEAEWKAIQDIPAGEDDDGQEIFACNAKECKKLFTTESALIKHSEKDHAGEFVVDQEAEREAPKRKPGRPPKEHATA
jgi:hypothetical protein